MRTLPRTARHIPMKPVEPRQRRPGQEAEDPEDRRPTPKERAMEPSGLVTLVAVKKMRTARGTMMMAMARNWRRRKASAPSWMAAAISRIFAVPVSAASTPRMRTGPRRCRRAAAARAMTNHTFSVPWRTKLWYPPSAASKWVMCLLLPSHGSRRPGTRLGGRGLGFGQ